MDDRTNDVARDLARQHGNAGQRRQLNVRPLAYYRQDPRELRAVVVPVALQFLIGFLVVSACVALSTVIGLQSRLGFTDMCVYTTIGLLVLLTVIQLATKWTGFVPGATTGLLAAPVTFFFACALQFGAI